MSPRIALAQTFTNVCESGDHGFNQELFVQQLQVPRPKAQLTIVRSAMGDATVYSTQFTAVYILQSALQQLTTSQQ